MAKELKLKATKFWGPNPTFVEVTGEKLVGGPFCPPTPILNRVNDMTNKSMTNSLPLPICNAEFHKDPLFLLYINDMPQTVDCDLFLYADGICLLFQHKGLK